MTVDAVAPADFRIRIDRLEAAGAALRARARDDRIAVVARVAARWRAPRSPWRRRALDLLPKVTGHAPGAVRHALDHLWAALDAREIAAVAARELEPVLPALLAEALAAEDPALGEALAVVHWPGGSAPHETLALARSSVVLAYGRGETLDRLAARAPSRLLRFGPRLSVALVCREGRDGRTAAAAARQVALYDQQGCLSPQVLVVEEEDDAAGTAVFLDALASSLRALATELPRAPLGLDEATDAWRYLELHRWRAQEGAAVEVRADAGAAFSIVSDRTGALPASPLNRHLVVLPVASLDAARAALGRLAGVVEAVGVAAPPGRLADAAGVAAAIGAHRMCPLDRLQAPPFAWRQSGHARLASFLVPAISEARASIRHEDAAGERMRGAS